MSNFNILVIYGDHSKEFSCSSRREFGSTVSRFFGLDKSEIQLFELGKNFRNPITINDLKDKMKVEIKKYNVPISRNNGEKLERAKSDPIKAPDIVELKRKLTDNRVLSGAERKFILHVLDNFSDRLERAEIDPIKTPDIVELKRKLTDNRVLSGAERKFILYMLDSFSDSTFSNSRKRKRSPERDKSVETANKKVQVNITAERQHSTYTQTDPLLNHDPGKPSTSKELIDESKRLARLEKKDRGKVRKLMDETFEERRQFIMLKTPVVNIVKEKYPLLFSTDEVINELNRIFYDKQDEEFLSNIKRYSKSILSCIPEHNPLERIISDAVLSAESSAEKSYAQQVGAILSISNILHEKRVYLDTEDEPCEKNNYPRIEAPCEVSELFKGANTYKIVVEGVVLCVATTFPEAVLCLLACYFIFNISYPQKAFNTFVLMEKLFLDANDTDVNDIDMETTQIITFIKLRKKS